MVVPEEKEWRRQTNVIPEGVFSLLSFFLPQFIRMTSRRCGTTEEISIKVLRPHHAAFPPLDALDRFLFLDATALPLGKIIVMATQDRLDVLLKVFAELSYFLLYVFSCFGLRHSVLTYLSAKNFDGLNMLLLQKNAETLYTVLQSIPAQNGLFVGCLPKPHNLGKINQLIPNIKKI